MNGFVGNTSKYVEGFETFTVDDEMMLANLKQAVNYTKANMAIGDVNKKLSTEITNNSPPPIAPKSRIINSDIPLSNKSKTNTIERKAPTLPENSSSITTKNNKNNKIDSEVDGDGEVDGESGDAEVDGEADMEVDGESGESGESGDAEAEADAEADADGEATGMDNDEDSEEGFQGSQYIESQTLRKMLLALLITFLGYMVILSFTNNLIPISTYAPHLKPFKHFIYGGLFFLIVYLCLEVF